MKTVTPELMEKFERVANDTGLAQKLIIKGEARGKALGIAEGRALGVTEGRALGVTEGKALGVTEGKALGVTEGRALGVTEAKIEAARSLLDLLTDKVIAERLELPLATVVALHKK